MSFYKAPPKDPDSVLDYGFNWRRLLRGDTIAESSWAVSSSDLQIMDSSHDDKTTTVRLSGGIAGETYTVTNHIVMASGQEDDRSFTLQVRER